MALALTGNLPDNGQSLDADVLRAEFTNITDNPIALISPFTGAVAAGANKITGLGAATANGDAVRFEQLGWNLLSRQTAASSGSIIFSTGLTSTYDEYVLTISNLVPAIDNVNLQMRVSQSAAFASGSVYQWVIIGAKSSDALAGFQSSQSDTSLTLATNLGSTAGKNFCGEIRFWGPSLTNVPKQFHWAMTYTGTTGAVAIVTGAGTPSGIGLGAIDGIQFFASADNIAIGDFTLFGIRKT